MHALALAPRTLAVLVAAVVLTACGDAEQSARQVAPEPTKAEYLRSANAICVRLGVETEELATRTFGDKPPEQSQLSTYTAASQRLQDGSLAKLRALTPPPGDEATVAGIYDVMGRAMRDLALVLTDKPDAADKVPGTLVEYQRRAQAYGLKDCR